MRKFITSVLLLILLFSGVIAEARGGRDDCPPDSTDPDCKAASGGR